LSIVHAINVKHILRFLAASYAVNGKPINPTATVAELPVISRETVGENYSNKFFMNSTTNFTTFPPSRPIVEDNFNHVMNYVAPLMVLGGGMAMGVLMCGIIIECVKEPSEARDERTPLIRRI
jgi:hypothetical protein